MANKYAAMLAIMLPSFVYGFFRFSIGFLVPKLEGIYSINDAAAGGVVSASVGLVTVGVFLSGYFSRSYGDRNTITLGLLIFAVSIGAIAVPGNLYEFTGLFLLASFGSGLVIPAAYGLIGTTLPRRKGVAVGFVTSGYNLGGLLGPPLVTLILLDYGWNGPFETFSLVGGVALLLFWLILRREGGSHQPSASSSLRSLLKNRVILILLLAMFLADLGFIAYVSWTPEYVTNRFSLARSSPELVGTFFGIGVGLGGVGALIVGTLFDKLGGRRSALIGGLGSAFSALGIYLTSSFLVSLALIVVAGFLSNWFWTILTAMAQANVVREDRSGAISLVQTVGFVGGFVGPGLAGLIGGATSSALILTVTLPYLAYAVVVAGLYKDTLRPPQSVQQ